MAALPPPTPSGFGQQQVNPNAPQLPLAQPLGQPPMQTTPGGLQGNIGDYTALPVPGAGNQTTSSYAGNTNRISSGNPSANPSNNPNATQWNSNFSPVDTGTDQFRQFGDQMYDHSISRMQPQIDQRNNQLAQSLIDRGLQPGTDAYNAEMTLNNNRNNDMLSATALGAEQLGLQAQNQYFGQQSANNQFGLAQNQQNYGQQFGYDSLANALEQSRIGASAQTQAAGMGASASMHNANLRNQLGYSQLASNDRQFDINDIYRTQGQDQNFLLGLMGQNNAAQQTAQQGFNTQQNANNQWWNQSSGMLSNAPGVHIPQNQGYTSQQIQGNQNAMQQGNAYSQALASVIGGGISALPSDSRLKENIELIDNVDDYNVYEWNYIGDDIRYKGVMADEVILQKPEAVTWIDGFMHVFYDLLPIDMEVAA